MNNLEQVLSVNRLLKDLFCMTGGKANYLIYEFRVVFYGLRVVEKPDAKQNITPQ
jgi:hypothetical protein